MSEVNLKSKVGCFLPKSLQIVLGTSRRLEVDLGSLLYQLWGRIGTLKLLQGLRLTLMIFVITQYS